LDYKCNVSYENSAKVFVSAWLMILRKYWSWDYDTV